MTIEQKLSVFRPDDGTEARIAEFYDKEVKSGRYNEGYSTPICIYEDAIVMGHIASLLQGMVVDIGCGDGLPLQYTDVPDYHGIDISPAMIEEARKKYPGKDFRVCDMHQLPFANEGVDTLLSLYGPFSYSLKPDDCLAEFCRVLKPGGHLAIMPYTRRVELGLSVGDYSTAVNHDIPKIFYSTEKIQKLFGRHPFENVSIHGINYFANMVEEMAKKFGNHHTPEFYRDLLDQERQMEAHLPIEYARHVLVIARKI